MSAKYRSVCCALMFQNSGGSAIFFSISNALKIKLRPCLLPRAQRIKKHLSTIDFHPSSSSPLSFLFCVFKACPTKLMKEEKKENTYRSTIPPALVAHIRHKSVHKYAHKTWISPTLPSPSLLYLPLPHPLPLAHLLAPNSLKIGVCGVHLEASLGWKSSGHSPKPSAARRLSAPKSRKMGQYSAAFE